MAIKKLQNNFTTPEQSKRLLELGVPADCADMIIESGCDVKRTIPDWTVFSKWCCNSDGIINYDDVMPCWSVGRLIEIYHICDKPGCSFSFHVCFPNLVSEMIYKIAEAKEHGWIDFSKLED